MRQLFYLFIFVYVRSSGEGNGTPLQSSCLENPKDGGAWWAPIYGVTQSRNRLKRLSSSSSSSMLDLHWRVGLTLAVASGGYSLIAVHWLLTVVASLVVENELQGMSASVVVGTWAQWLQLPGLEHRLNSGRTWAELLHGTWDLPGSGIEPMTPALAGGFFTTEPQGKPETRAF